jgi:hypothetical protein
VFSGCHEENNVLEISQAHFGEGSDDPSKLCLS